MWRKLATVAVAALAGGVGFVVDGLTTDGGLVFLAMFVVVGVGFSLLWPVETGWREPPGRR